VNAYEVKAGIGVVAGNLCDPCLSVQMSTIQVHSFLPFLFFF